MQKSELIAHVAKTADVTQVQAAAIINAVLDTITAELEAGNKVVLTGFGTFEVHKTAARTGVHPRTKEKLQIAAGKRTAFSAGQFLKDAVSGKAAKVTASKKPTSEKKTAPADKKKKK